MTITKLLSYLRHYPALMGAGIIGWTISKAGIDTTTQSVLYVAGSALILEGGLKLAGLLPNDAPDTTTGAKP